MNYDIILMVGIPLSGKSTMSKHLSLEHGHVIICPDMVRLAIHGHQFIPSAENFVWATAYTMARTLLMQGDRVIVDATNTHKTPRSKWVDIAKELNKTICACVMLTPYTECIHRNNRIKRLDPSVIQKMINQYQFPRGEEGFDAIYRVLTKRDGYKINKD